MVILLKMVKGDTLRSSQISSCTLDTVRCIMNLSVLQIYRENGEDEEGFPKEGEQGSCPSFTDGGTATGRQRTRDLYRDSYIVQDTSNRFLTADARSM